MNDIIQLLPDSIANQIAAGEVVQRPASVVKELLENAIDAGATEIKLIIKDAGRTLIQVIDNGKGMSSTDARLAFERHATSKIRTASDLFSLSTMGFRGEALPSIAAVSHIDLKTKRLVDEIGTHIVICGSVLEKQEPIAIACGSNFSVKNLFYNVPARRKFLKSNETERRNIIIELERIALVNDQIAFAYIENDIETFNYPQSNLKQRILSVIGKNLNQQLIPIEIETTIVKIYGYIGKPESARKSRPLQYFFVNGRYMRHPYFAKAITNAFEPLISSGENPNFFIYLTVQPDTIDVNIHPTKTEIKFENEQAIWQILSATVKEALGKSNEVPTIDFDTDGAIDIPIMQNSVDDIESLRPKLNIDPNYNPFKQSSSSNGNYSNFNQNNNYHKRKAFDWETLYDNFENDKQNYILDNKIEETTDNQLFSSQNKSEISTEGVIYYQYKNKYILTSAKSGLMMIDQRRAHIRVLFDKFLQTIKQKKGFSQRVLFPEIVEFSASESVMLPYVMDDIEALGFEITLLGNNSYAINGIPAEVENLNSVELIRNIVLKSIEIGVDTKDEVQESLALSMSKATAIRYGQSLTNEEIVKLVNDLFLSTTHNYTPEGKLIISLLDDKEIEVKFK